MIKRILVGSTVAALALGGFAVHSYGQSAPSPTTCYRPDLSGTATVKYDTQRGVSMYFSRPNSDAWLGLTATIPLEVGGEPNPHFDRLYALAMKGFDNRRIAEVCVEGNADATGDRPVVSLTLNHTGDELQKVQVCDGSSCADVYYDGRLRVVN